ncbi:hypothetical protein STCU_01907 [Strigomonas culicis]|uniref:CNNM transmembrane domain-containing protein n=1 Tax=Strigomonas culicis TaxID=28005 RepID=S9UYN7_9TRYP|nr:hypothetical protein STCU_05716 [Strigomonas culicis]EPY33859.1 hypothetical protein STCU_01907 [Strigomonas culicis]|eukprot:EPY27507.1 hypothetical protein STCU_05716 [Strigomonas culicis]
MTEGEHHLTSTEKSLYGIGIVFFIMASGFTAGLQIALFSIDRLFLRVQSTTGDADMKRMATRLLGVLDRNHWTLVALILSNTFCMMTLPILLEAVFDELTALIVSITAVLFLGEVVPLSFFVRYAVPICAFFVPFVWFAIVVTAPVSYPVGRLLDHVLGTHEQLLDRDGIAALLVGHQGEETEDAESSLSSTVARHRGAPSAPATDVVVVDEGRRGDAAPDSGRDAESSEDEYQLQTTEIRMLRCAMQLSTDTVLEHLGSTVDDAFMLSTRSLLDEPTIRRILLSGFSRVPVYLGENRKQIVGALIVNSLVHLCLTNPDPPLLLGDYPLCEVVRLPATASLHDAYQSFRSGACYMAIVYDARGSMVGLLTLADVLSSLYKLDSSTAGVAQSAHTRRRQNCLVELMESMRFLNATKKVTSISMTASHERKEVPGANLQVDGERINATGNVKVFRGSISTATGRLRSAPTTPLA